MIFFLLHNCGVSRTHFIIVVTDSMQFKEYIENNFNSEFFNKNYGNGCRWGDSEGASCVFCGFECDFCYATKNSKCNYLND